MKVGRFFSEGRIITGTFSEADDLTGPDGRRYDITKVQFLPPVCPTKMIGLVLNYADHANELGLSTQEDPVLFIKPNNTLIGHRGSIIYPSGAKYLHYEGELAVIISRQARKIKAKESDSFIKGYTIANELTVRDFITNTFRPPVKAKGFDTFCPLGPFYVTRDELPDASNLAIKTVVNGETRQDGNTRNLIHTIPKLIEFITSFMTLEENDVILTGTPKGISPIVPGDRVEITIEKIGTLSNDVVAE
jgi:5-oxopent-3-ene-1,2,5-tricarboxylate decarboxylase / 2-hydroxyhepta-2,4-diene-1,7-dioate isomerase